jgi:MarR family transcriptional regulator, organic hydroperoxide resistance regulator
MDDQRSPATVLDPQPGREAGLAPEGPEGPALAAAALAAEPAGQADLLSEPVPHVHPLTTEPLSTEPLSTGPLTDEQLNQQISETFTEIIKHAHDLGQSIATEFGLTGSDAMALFKLEAPMTMKELGLRMGCDPSFITTIADALEKHGLARREPSLRDRRSKNIVLTPEGMTVRDRLCQELMARAPWCTALDTGERRCLLGLMRKMLKSRGGR